MIRDATRVDYEARIGEVLTFVEAHLDEDLSPARLARVAHFSGYHFHRVFRGVTGESVMELVRRLRLERAARRLRATEASVTEVAFEAGFSSHEAFTRAFAARFGAPPSSFRDRDGARVEALRAAGSLAPPDQVEVRKSGPRRFLYRRGVGSFADVPAAWEAFVVEARRSGVYTGAETLMGRYPDDPEITPAGRIRFDVGMVWGGGERPGSLREDHLAGGTWAVALHRGSYATLSETYLRLVGGWFVASGRALADGPCLEVYLHPPETTDEALLRTEVWAPIG